MTQHTPGPWYADKCPFGHYACNKYRIRHAGAEGMFEKDDALLIAAAPDLLSVLKGAFASAVWKHQSNCYCEVCEEIRAAIAKAEGR